MLSRVFGFGRRPFESLSEQEILALAISSEEDDGRIYRAYADGLAETFPQSAKVFEAMAEEEDGHRDSLIELFRKRFGERIPLIRREHVKGYYERKPDWLVRPLGVEAVRRQAEAMERQAYLFYVEAAKRTTDASTRKLLGDLAAAEQGHESSAHALEQTHVPGDVKDEEAAAEQRQFILTYVQPGLAGLMDGSVSTLAPIFAAAFATHDTWQTFLVGLAASIGAGISMGFTEVASDDGKLSGRGSPVKRGITTGVMTSAGGLGHALPYLIPHFWTATAVAAVVVFFELWAIAFVQNRYMQTPFLRAAFQVVLGGALVFAAGVLIGNA
ncbi:MULTISPECIES: iron exporter MbfA [unclassified Mesorhizobium]|uniref:iron exporter MbfA n=1 Tax=unclassified Mesorhizobium TaxID=325217 RepID=UPI000FD70CBE|nr:MULTISPECIES: ferritin family protein [unclassified Mesorhizobium]TGR42848.1 rubrerythrin family protein [bacterium M00.F.Ca.ET.199.01.1.1]TGU29982.1 rubrerythrin family protein [bacterium M00.F.Ca.ET.156.01.1.1]TGV84709.1 rubrerythrin family protein [Mesorhizobium sp. M00.F.Ca.ET.149.01.1.1]TGR24072.1 rubrerythrin family protein [Mesorhizobium sp. M8A.F.Ca.ET.202.01.1.1]TGR27053.1 rubrerythrin family protein [Mesorhizobium sp. M8A.F.Ca.ET.197.01.1.1]